MPKRMYSLELEMLRDRLAKYGAEQAAPDTMWGWVNVYNYYRKDLAKVPAAEIRERAKIAGLL